MSVCKLLTDFSKRLVAPVSLNDIVAELRARGVTDEIKYVRDEALDPRILRGYLCRTEKVVDGSISYTSTIVHATMSPGEERIVCAKELIHILDPEGIRVSDRSRLQDLIQKISLPPEVADLVEKGDHVTTDIDALTEAVALLFPLALRNQIYKDYISKKVKLDWIADKMELPVDYVSSVMNGYWPIIHDSLVAQRQRLEEARTPIARPPKPKTNYG